MTRNVLPTILCLLVAMAAWAGDNGTTRRVQGQTIYVPVYSHVYFGDRETPFLLAVTVVVRNTDRHHPLLVWSAEYHDSAGKLLKRFVPEAIHLPPLATTRFVIPESDAAGGAGASLLVNWKSAVPVTPPIIESIMIGTRNQQGISFSSRGQILEETPGPPEPVMSPEPAPEPAPQTSSGPSPARADPSVPKPLRPASGTLEPSQP